MNFARSTRLFVLLGILFLYFGGSARYFGGGSNVTRYAGLFCIGLGVLLGVLSLFGVGRPANERYKAPWISLSLGCTIILFVGMGTMSAALRGTAQGNAPATARAAIAPFIDNVNGFRLDDPGEGWTILSPENLRVGSETAAAGARNGADLAGFVFVEPLEPDFRIVGREQEVGQLMIDQIEVADKRIVYNRPDELDGQKAVRCQVVGKIAWLGIRYEAVTLIANGRLYRLIAFGASDQTADDGLAFRPFMAAFHVLPEQQAPPDDPEAPPARN